MSKYTAIDAAICKAIEGGNRTFSQMQTMEIRTMAHKLDTGGGASRVVDRRLQAMRKAGRLIHSHASGWHVVGERE